MDRARLAFRQEFLENQRIDLEKLAELRREKALQSSDSAQFVNLLGDPRQDLTIGSPVTGVFEHHHDDDPSYSLLQWVLR